MMLYRYLRIGFVFLSTAKWMEKLTNFLGVSDKCKILVDMWLHTTKTFYDPQSITAVKI